MAQLTLARATSQKTFSAKKNCNLCEMFEELTGRWEKNIFMGLRLDMAGQAALLRCLKPAAQRQLACAWPAPSDSIDSFEVPSKFPLSGRSEGTCVSHCWQSGPDRVPSDLGRRFRAEQHLCSTFLLLKLCLRTAETVGLKKGLFVPLFKGRNDVDPTSIVNLIRQPIPLRPCIRLARYLPNISKEFRSNAI